MTAEVLDRLANRSTITDGCWLWNGAVNSRGYGSIGIDGKAQSVHRVAYELTFGPIPDGLVIDHLCHNGDLSCTGGLACEHRRCWRPDHLEAVTSAQNNQRSHLNGASRTHCPQGHAYDKAITRAGRIRRGCQRCLRASSAASAARTLAASDGHPATWKVGKSAYRMGCRCAGCTEANRDYMRSYVARRALLHPTQAAS